LEEEAQAKKVKDKNLPAPKMNVESGYVEVETVDGNDGEKREEIELPKKGLVCG